MKKLIFCLLFFFARDLVAEPIHLFLVRHGQTDWNVERRLQGQTDTLLNEMGRKEAAEMQKRLEGISFDICISSDLRRASETAEILIEGKPLVRIEDARLRERNFGPWEGYLISEVKELTEVETDAAMQERIFAALDMLAEQNKESKLLVVTHGGVIKNILTKINPSIREVHVQNMGLLHLIFEKGQWFVAHMERIEIAQN
jgi:broad specificity phosphatase PhoE